MGRRSRARAASSVDAPPVAAPASRGPSPRRRGERGLTPERRAIAAFLLAAVVIAGLTVVGVALLNGVAGAAIVLAYALGLGLLVQRLVGRRLRGLALSDEDRIFQTLAGGLILIAVAFALAALVLELVAA